MTSGTKLLGRALLTSLPVFVACSTGKPPAEGDDDVGTGATGGTTSNGGGAATGMGGSAASMGGTISATGGVSGSAAVGGTAGDTAAMGGDTSLGGTSGGAASGGDAGTAALGGASGASAAAGMGGMAGTDPGICQHLSAVPTPQVPTVEIVVDTSSSMFETTPTAWTVLYAALDGPEGVVKELQGEMHFGFASYKGKTAPTETDPACAMMTIVDPALSNFDAIDAVYGALGGDTGGAYTLQHPPPKWETPTNYAIGFAVQELQAYDPMPPGPKYILLVTDGNPNTCATTDPQCGQDYAIKAAQDAYAAGIGLFVLGVGDIVSNTSDNAGCEGTGARCGLNHLQDMANAGVGAGVMPAPNCEDPTSTACQYRYLPCNKDSTLTATYTAEAPAVGTPFAVDTNAADAPAKLKTALRTLLSNAVSCTFEMDVIVTGDPALGIVSVSSSPVAYDMPDGWMLEADSFHVTLQGAACEAYRAGGEVSIDFPCDPSGNPIAVHR
jgi:hypothetical protein